MPFLSTASVFVLEPLIFMPFSVYKMSKSTPIHIQVFDSNKTISNSYFRVQDRRVWPARPSELLYICLSLQIAHVNLTNFTSSRWCNASMMMVFQGLGLGCFSSIA
jgi:hypothetical protein